jgi:beta-glucosidase
VQQRLIRAVAAAGKPTALVNLSGSAIALPELPSHVAIIQAWYPGQRPDAVADVIFGDYNPAGRLPVTFYKSVADLPPFTNYDMANRTYRYFKGEPQFAFGDGLSYTTFNYDNLKVDKPELATDGGPVKVSVDVANTGSRDGEEVVQLYLTHKDAPIPAPIRALKGFKRIALKAGEKKTVEFTLTPYQLALADESGARMVFPGTVTVAVGGNQRKTVNAEIKLTGQPTGAQYAYEAPAVR